MYLCFFSWYSYLEQSFVWIIKMNEDCWNKKAYKRMRRKCSIRNIRKKNKQESCYIWSNLVYRHGFSWWLRWHKICCNAGDLGSISGLGRSPGRGHDNPLQYSCLENPQGQRSLEGYSLWGHKELDMAEQLSTEQHSI